MKRFLFIIVLVGLALALSRRAGSQGITPGGQSPSNTFIYYFSGSNTMLGTNSATNLVSTNDQFYYSTNTVAATTNWMPYTNPNPGVASCYTVVFSLTAVCRTNPIQNNYNYSASFVVTNNTTTTGCEATNNAVTHSSSGNTVAVTTSVIGAAGFGIVITGATTNTESYVTRTEIITP